MADPGSLRYQVEYLKAGGDPRGEKSTDRLNRVFESISKTGQTLQGIADARLQRKKAEIDEKRNELLSQPLRQQLGLAGTEQVQPGDVKAGILNLNADQISKASSVLPMLSTQPDPEAFINPSTGEISSQPREGFIKTQAGKAADISSQYGLKRMEEGNQYIYFNPKSGQTSQVAADGFIKVKSDTAAREATRYALEELKRADSEGDNRMLSVYEAKSLGLPMGATVNDAKGVLPISQADRNKIDELEAAQVLINDIKSASQDVNVFDAGKFGFEGLVNGLDNYAGAVLKTNPKAARLQAKVAALANLARSLGEKGTLTDDDIKRVAGSTPSLRDPKNIAEIKLSDLEKIFQEKRSLLYNRFSTPVSVGGGGSVTPSGITVIVEEE